MPPAKIPTIVDMCVKNIATNVVRHSQNFRELPCKSRIYRTYVIMQRLYSDAILKEVEHIYRSGKATGVSHFMMLSEFLYEGKTCLDYYVYYYRCLRFLFNKYTSHASLLGFGKLKTILPYDFLCVFSECKNLKSLALMSGTFVGVQILELMIHHHLVKIDLLLCRSCTDDTLREILRKCPNLQILRAGGERISDRCLFYLCVNDTLDYFRFCPDDGQCCHLGKKLTQLMLYGTRITGGGIACALQHLPLLQKFRDGALWYSPDGAVFYNQGVDYHLVPFGICELQKEAVLHYGSLHFLKLTTIVFDAFSWHLYHKEVRECCPYLNTFVCYTGLFSVFSTEPWADEAMTSGMFCGRPPYFATNLHAILLCLRQPGIKWFCTEGRAVVIFSDGFNEFEPPAHVRNLEHIDLCRILLLDRSVLKCFTDILSQASGVKFLSLSREIAQTAFVNAMERNPFSKLEEISFKNTDLGNICLRHLIESGSSLKRITFQRCVNAAFFVKEHKKYARQNNFSLAIERVG